MNLKICRMRWWICESLTYGWHRLDVDLTRLASDLGQARQKYICTIPSLAAYVRWWWSKWFQLGLDCNKVVFVCSRGDALIHLSKFLWNTCITMNIFHLFNRYSTDWTSLCDCLATALHHGTISKLLSPCIEYLEIDTCNLEARILFYPRSSPEIRFPPPLCSGTDLPAVCDVGSRRMTYLKISTLLQFPYPLIFPFAWDISCQPQDISLGSRETLQYFPDYYSYRRVLQKLGKNTAHYDYWRRVKKDITCHHHLCLCRCL